MDGPVVYADRISENNSNSQVGSGSAVASSNNDDIIEPISASTWLLGVIWEGKKQFLSAFKKVADQDQFIAFWNGKYVVWSNRFFGNQSVPGEFVSMFKAANVQKLSQYSKVGQEIRFLNGFNYGYSALGILNGISSGNYYSALQNGVDLGMNYVSTMGIPGFVVGTAWTFGGKTLFWWGSENTYKSLITPSKVELMYGTHPNPLQFIRGAF